MPPDEAMHKFHLKEFYGGSAPRRKAKKKKRSLADAYHERRESRKTERKESRNFYTAED